MTINNLIGLRYEWGAKPSDGHGATDCFFLSMAARKCLGLSSWEDEFQWVYERAFDHKRHRLKVMRQCLQIGEYVDKPSIGDVILFRTGTVGLATMTDSGLLYITKDGLSQVASLFQFAPSSYYCFREKQ